MLKEGIKQTARKFADASKDKEIFIVSHFDTDGITSAAIMVQTLKFLDKRFSLKIVKSLEKEFIQKIPLDKIVLFLDLASSNLQDLADSKIKEIFIIDHHEITEEIPERINLLNPCVNDSENLSGAGLTYLFCKELNPKSRHLAKLAVLGTVGDQMEKNLNKLNKEIVSDSEVKNKTGLLLYPSTRPLNRALEFCSHPYIPGVTGNTKGVLELLREAGMAPHGGKYKSLIELDSEEMKRLTTAIMLRNPRAKSKEIIGDIFLIKIFNKLEDARELSAMINACSRLGRSDIALQLCMEIPKAKKQAESIHAKYRQLIISGLNTIDETEKIEGKKFVIINAREKIKDTIIGTLASIISYSPLYEEGTLIIAMAYYENKIKVSARNSGNCGRNTREVLAKVVQTIGGEVGGHEHAAGCMILQEKEQEFTDLLKKSLEVEIIKIS